jgi:hypothetical protein
VSDAKTVPLARQEQPHREVLRFMGWVLDPPIPPTDEGTLAAEIEELTARGFVAVDDAGRYSVTGKGMRALAVSAEPAEEPPLWLITLTDKGDHWDLLADEIRY